MSENLDVNDSQRLLQMSEDLRAPIQVTMGDGAIRQMAVRVAQARQTMNGETTPGSCGGVAGGWGN